MQLAARSAPQHFCACACCICFHSDAQQIQASPRKFVSHTRDCCLPESRLACPENFSLQILTFCNSRSFSPGRTSSPRTLLYPTLSPAGFRIPATYFCRARTQITDQAKFHLYDPSILHENFASASTLRYVNNTNGICIYAGNGSGAA